MGWPDICKVSAAMYTTETLNVLRTLNWLDKEHRCLAEGSAAGALVEQQQRAIRVQLPPSVLALHDRLAARGKPSVVALAGTSCSGCHLKLPSGTVGELRGPDRYVVCPNCNAFVWSGEQVALPVVAPAKKKAARKSVPV